MQIVTIYERSSKSIINFHASIKQNLPKNMLKYNTLFLNGDSLYVSNSEK